MVGTVSANDRPEPLRTLSARKAVKLCARSVRGEAALRSHSMWHDPNSQPGRGSHKPICKGPFGPMPSKTVAESVRSSTHFWSRVIELMALVERLDCWAIDIARFDQPASARP